ncbi:peptide MFS transporter [Arthrobacter ginkgonis]|uniref:Peptide MFS transporter n=1 Tax=Arthrobacter ginkgonis TaxID=1630594 RepID=A0ABP7BP74_9MICC
MSTKDFAAPAAERENEEVPASRPSLFSQPKGLLTLSATEMWERFSFYGLQVILAYYLYYSLSEGGLGIATPVALGIAGAYGGVVYISQMLGGWLADRLLAPRTLVLVGGILIMLGHIALAVLPGIAGLMAGLLLIVLGTGGLKVNTTSMVGELYSREDSRRDVGYSIYYTGISIGAFLGPLLTGFLQPEFGFHVAFSAAAVGMGLGLVQYVFGMKRLPAVTRTVPNPLPRQMRARAALIAVVGAAALVTGTVTGFINFENIDTLVTVIVLVAALAYFAVLLSSRKVDRAERLMVHTYIPVFLSSLLFWTLLFQLFTTLALYMDTRVNLTIGDLTLPPALIITLEGLFATLIAPVFAAIWAKMGTAQPESGKKVVAGIACMSLTLLSFAFMGQTTGPVNSVLVVLIAMVLFGVAEIVVVPTALSLTARLAPRAASAQMTSLYFLTMAGGSTLSGFIAQAYSPENEGFFFSVVGLGSLAAAVGLYLVYRALNRKVPAL